MTYTFDPKAALAWASSVTSCSLGYHEQVEQCYATMDVSVLNFAFSGIVLSHCSTDESWPRCGPNARRRIRTSFTIEDLAARYLGLSGEAIRSNIRRFASPVFGAGPNHMGPAKTRA